MSVKNLLRTVADIADLATKLLPAALLGATVLCARGDLFDLYPSNLLPW